MGCTMHTHIEVKRGDRWGHFAAPNVKRDYKLFNLIAAVRNNPPDNRAPVCKHFGLPDDMPAITRVCRNGDAGLGIHHEGWLDANDIRELQDRLYAVSPGIERTGIDALDLEHSIFNTYILGGCIASHAGFDDVRIVFWFDN